MRPRTPDRRPATDLRTQAREFFFARELPYGLAAVRILLPLILCFDLMHRWPYVREIFSADGATAPIWITYGFPTPIPELPGAIAVALFTLLLASLITSSLGWMTRASLTIATSLYFYFTILDSIGTLTKYTVIATHVLLLLTVSHCGDVWSLDALRRGTAPQRSTVWPRRLMQFMFCATYIGAAMTKIHTPAYFNGDQMMWWILTHVNGHHPIGESMAYYPALLTVGAYAAIVWEILFAFLVWRDPMRSIMLALGVGFHVMTWVMLGLDIFPCVVISGYFCFANERDAWRFRRFFHRMAIRLDVPLWNLIATAQALIPARRLGPIAFVALMWIVSLGGAAAERVQDPYGERGPDGPMALRKLDDATVRTMLAGSKPLRPSDQIFAFELGNGTFSDALIGRKQVFEKGETLIAQCIAAPPHGDMYVECNLHSGDGRIIERRGLILVRESNRLNFTYTLCNAVEPGDYELVLKVSGTDVARRRFVIQSDEASPSSTTHAPTVAAALAD